MTFLYKKEDLVSDLKFNQNENCPELKMSSLSFEF